MSCDLCEDPTQQSAPIGRPRGRTRQRTIQSRPRRNNTTSPPKFSTNSAKVACRFCAPYYAKKVWRRSLIQNEVLSYNKAVSGKSAKLAVEELCGDSRDWLRPPISSGLNLATCHDAGCSDDLVTQLAISEALHDDPTLLGNLFAEQSSTLVIELPAVQTQLQNSVPDFAFATPRSTHVAAAQHETRNYDGCGSPQTGLNPPQLHPEFTFPAQPADTCQPNPLSPLHFWPRVVGLTDSTLAQDTATSVCSRTGHLCEAIASYSQMFSASWMPQLATVPSPSVGAVQGMPQHAAECAVVEEEPVNEDFEHLSQISEQDWYSTDHIEEDDYVLV